MMFKLTHDVEAEHKKLFIENCNQFTKMYEEFETWMCTCISVLSLASKQLIIWQIFCDFTFGGRHSFDCFFYCPKCDVQLFSVHMKSVKEEKEKWRERKAHRKTSRSNINSCNVAQNNIIAACKVRMH